MAYPLPPLPYLTQYSWGGGGLKHFTVLALQLSGDLIVTRQEHPRKLLKKVKNIRTVMKFGGLQRLDEEFG